MDRGERVRDACPPGDAELGATVVRALAAAAGGAGARGRGLRVAAVLVSVYLLVIWMPNMTDVIHAFDYKPSLTTLGQQRQQKTLLLLH